MHVLVGGEPQVSLPASFHYQRSDPYAVLLSIGTASTGTVDWIFALDLLREGMSRPVGEGAVLVAPRLSSRGAVVRVVVRSQVGSAALDIRTSAVADFLDRVHKVVPPGTEGSCVDIDHLVTRLLGTGA
ncbi:Streptomyces sporulation and cell division protein, SsgA [Actinacidiphila cocklensis]|uniref:Streptomyces sporulation and cell division protein, SsgA n=1 Tax=Actinacidiphila cocklensis TaxID=887465 RepID=A0A9W4DJ82_9ACTN|nr:Streptomyces sporulation and cell division protein, SsgA [Actinacidiphila cocklensis]